MKTSPLSRNSKTPSLEKFQPQNTLYNVEKILSHRTIKKKKQYLIKWEGYDINSSTWEPKKNLSPFSINEYEKKKKICYKKSKSIANKKIAVPKFGNFQDGDELEEIKGIYPENEKIMAYVKWKKQKNGQKPLDSLVSTTELRENVPLLLVNFYEKNLSN